MLKRIGMRKEIEPQYQALLLPDNGPAAFYLRKREPRLFKVSARKENWGRRVPLRVLSTVVQD